MHKAICQDCKIEISNKRYKRCKKCFGKYLSLILKNKPANLRLKGKKHHSYGKRGHLVFGWKGGKITNPQGYFRIFCKTHPYGVKTNGLSGSYVLEHRLVMEKHLGRYLNPQEVVHHINGNRKDNRIENLMLFPNISAHHLFRHLNQSTFICKFCLKDQRT